MSQEGLSDPPTLLFKLFHKAELKHLVMLPSAVTLSHLNSLPEDLRGAGSMDTFERELKTFLFSLAFMECLILVIISYNFVLL